MTAALSLQPSDAPPIAPPRETIVAVRNLTKQFKHYPSPASRLGEWMTLGKLRRHTVFTALHDINFEVKKGEFFGIVGPNGSGKSTLLKILTGVLMPTTGSYKITGRVTSLLELGTGFNPEISGRENLINSGRLLGFEPEQTKQKLERIVAFAELEDSIDVPTKYYSTGMVVRLAFSLFAHVEPDVFIVDEALSVGDVAFSRKCFQRLDLMRESGCTLLFVSHDLGAVRKYCDHAMFLDHGHCAFLGSANAATDVYLEAMSPGGRERRLAPEGSKAGQPAGVRAAREEARRISAQLPAELSAVFDETTFGPLGNVSGRIGTGAVRIAAVAIRDEAGKRKEHFGIGESASIHLLAHAPQSSEHATVSVQLVNRLGVVAWGTNHHRLTGKTVRLDAGTWVHAVFRVTLDLGPDHYTLDASFGDASGEGHVFDRITAADLLVLEVKSHVDFEGIARIPAVSEVQSHPGA
ncbi:MAG: transporter related [Phycisphaerales bacterium]|nr:transporter related [Phycisphaerales bacterium]